MGAFDPKASVALSKSGRYEYMQLELIELLTAKAGRFLMPT